MYFSVNKPIKIATKVYIPCICYLVTSLNEPNVLKLVKEGKASLYEKAVFFQNGKVLEMKEENPIKVIDEKIEIVCNEVGNLADETEAVAETKPKKKIKQTVAEEKETE